METNNTDKKPDEKIFFFPGSGGRQLFGFLHCPKAQKNKKAGIIFCQPFADEKNTSHIVITNAARQLAREGFHVFRFDLSGCGDSQGELNEVTMSDWLEDLESAVSWLKRNTDIDRYALWGLRFGSGLALLHYSRNPDVSSLILWQPVLDFKEYINQFLFKKFASQNGFQSLKNNSVSKLTDELADTGFVYVIGYPITYEMYNSLIEIADTPLSIFPDCPTRILSISSFDRPILKIRRYVDNLSLKKYPVHFTHFTTEPFWDRYWRRECLEAANATLEWCDSTL